MQTFLMVALIVVLMSPLLVFCGLPLIAAAVLFHRLTPLWLGERSRRLIACGIAALGVAPAFDQFWMPKNIYLCWLDGDSVEPWFALASFFVTWLVVTLITAVPFRGRRQYA
ncbi:MAG: hypothetical protein JO006_01325 [Paucibacter sp.]|nr:hypothetical protein [Roseateles sp.]